MISILFICHGNICRSPMAEFVMKKMVVAAGVGDSFYIASAATTDEEIYRGAGNPVYPPVRKLLAAEGIDTAGKRATLLRREDYGKYDFLIGMDAENMYDMKEIFQGDPEKKCHLLLDYSDHPRNVADPWYTRDFQKTWQDVNEGCHGLLAYCLALLKKGVH